MISSTFKYKAATWQSLTGGGRMADAGGVSRPNEAIIQNMLNLIATKLRRPAVPPNRVQRPQLMRRLNEGLAAGHPLTLVSAPAGFGKTLCVSEWAGAAHRPVVWLSLEAEDDDPGRFFSYFSAALQQLHENLGREIGSVLRSGQLPPADTISAALLNDVLAWDGRGVLILDDFHVIQDRFILQVLEKLITNLPQSLQMVLLTREDPPLPLARLRANNQLTEIRASDLRFSDREAAQFLNDVLRLSLSPIDIAALEERTEGWVVGLQLAAFSIRDRANPSGFIATLSGNQRFILSYLTEEVLQRQPAEIQQFLLQTSILDKLNGEVCNAVTGRADGAQLLDRVLKANLFLIPLDDEQRWFRYHHLFADLLRDLQRAQHIDQAELHQRASRWFAQAGLPGEAIHHALAAADYALALQLIETHATDMLMQWYAKTVKEWLHALPPEWSRNSPRTNLAFAWMHLLHGHFEQVSLYVARLHEIFATTPIADAALQAEWLALQATLLNAQGQPAESLALAERARQIVPENEMRVCSQIYLAMVGAYQQLDDYDRTVDAYQRLIEYGRSSANLIVEMSGVSGLGLLGLHRGQLHFVFTLASQGIERIERSGSLPPIAATVYGELGEVCYQWNQIDQARRHFQRAVEVSVLSGYSDAAAYFGVVRSRLLQIEGDLDGAAREIQAMVDLMQASAPTAVREEVIAQQVRVLLAQDRITAAESVLQRWATFTPGRVSIPDLETARPLTYPRGLIATSALRVFVQQAVTTNDVTSITVGIELANRLINLAIQGPHVLAALLLRAQMQSVLGNEPAGLADILHALELAEPEGCILMFLEEGSAIKPLLQAVADRAATPDRLKQYARTLLTAFPATDRTVPSSGIPVAADQLIELLSKRELEILQLIGEGCSNQEIADRLVITLHTVKKHSSNIFAKLGVTSRTQAVARARQLGLL
jgi:LuxR family transcriptional regulator, maltose regulon positive regulatory protein